MLGLLVVSQLEQSLGGERTSPVGLKVQEDSRAVFAAVSELEWFGVGIMVDVSGSR